MTYSLHGNGTDMEQIRISLSRSIVTADRYVKVKGTADAQQYIDTNVESQPRIPE